jgi:prepilin-type processing-associated H-X9-DG protein
MVYIDSQKREEALPSKTVLLVELDLDNESVKSANDLAGDQVWDWDEGDECMGFNHEDNGLYYAHVCFADGHVEAIRDPSKDPLSPNTTDRQKLSKWYGSGGLASEGEKLD